MIRIKITYSDNEDPEQFINIFNNSYRVIKVSKQYHDRGQKKDLHKRIYVDLIQK